jgi:hypothetical protein
LASCFCNISCEASFTIVMMKSKSYTVSIVCILAKVALDFFQEEGFEGETFLFSKGSASFLGGVTSPCFCSYYFIFVSSNSSSPPRLGDTEAISSDVLLKSQTSLVFFLLLVLCVSCSLWESYDLSSSGSDISVGSAGIRRYVDQSLIISLRSSSVRF